MPKGGKSTDHDHNLIHSEGTQDRSTYKISDHSLNAFSGKCPETSLDGQTDMLQNGHGWSDGPTDPCTGEKRRSILYLAFILDDTVGEWHQVRDLVLCIKTLHVMILNCRFICVKLVWFETSNERTCNDRREGPGGESLPVNTWKHRAP